MKRRLLKLAGFLLLGAVINVAVAWGLAFLHQPPTAGANLLWSPPPSPMLAQATSDERSYWRVQTAELPGMLFAWSFRAQGAFAPDTTAFANTIDLAPCCGYWRSPMTPFADQLALIEHRELQAYGWPLLAMMANGDTKFLMKDARWMTIASHDGIELDRLAYQTPDHIKTNVSIPLRPIVSGFVVNTIIFATVAWVLFMLFVAPFSMRCRLRRRRGLCLACAYPVGTSPLCTECGAAVTPKAMPA